jgi:hypothetical protein
LNAIHWGIHPQVTAGHLSLAFAVLVFLPTAAAEPISASLSVPPTAPTTTIDAPARSPATPPAAFRPSWDLDGIYLWLGPIGAASYVDHTWDSTFGGEAAVVAIHERRSLSLVGANAGASRWTGRGGGRVWVDGLVGTRLLGRMMGASLGPILELSELAHPRIGASIGLWGFAGITPFARAGAVLDLGVFAELGVHFALPVLRR